MKKGITLVLAAMLLLSCTALCGCKSKTEAPAATEAPVATEAPAATEEPTETEAPAATEASAETAEPAEQEGVPADGEQKAIPKGVVLVQTNTQFGFLPLPAPGEEDIVYPIVQYADDGTKAENHLHLSSEGFYMEYSTCENQDCVQEGEVTFDNREERILGSWVVCLPNGVSLELYSIEEFYALLEEAQAEMDAETGAVAAAPEASPAQ